jgi:hypothetical protein
MKGFLRFLRGNTIALLALFIALGGTTYAATALPKNSVGTKQLKKNAVTAAKIKKGAVANAKIGANAVTGAKTKDDSLTGADILESSLGQVPSAASATNATTAANAGKLDGLDSTAFAPAGKVLAAGPVRLAPTDVVTLFSSGPFTVVARCAAGQATIVLQHAENILDPTGTGDVNLAPGGDTTLVTATFASSAAAIERRSFTALTLVAGLQGVATATATSTLCEAAAFGIAS